MDKVGLVWVGDAVPINRRHGIGYMNRGGKKVPFIRNETGYTKFIEDMAWTWKNQIEGRRFNGPVLVEIILKRRIKRGRHVDVDAYTKQIMDALEKSGLIENDDQIVAFSIDGSAIPMKKDDEEIIVLVSPVE